VSPPTGQRSGLPQRVAKTRAPRKGPAMPRRVTSTSGSSGMTHYVRMNFSLFAVSVMSTICETVHV
jgi:hypothetical protein